jgi:3'(2'), 5'-bisphosphate nucleotidase
MTYRYHKEMAFARSQLNSLPVGAPEWSAVLDRVGGPEGLVSLAQGAAQLILDIYQQTAFSSATKADGSPVSEADLAAAAYIEKALTRSGVPVVCEESVQVDTRPAEIFWLVDPLDGTKEFIKRTGEFSVNIALVADGEPVVGVISVPVSGEVFIAVRGQGVEKIAGGLKKRLATARDRRSLIAAISRSHLSEREEAFLKRYDISETIVCGSAIKFCRVAEGCADIYIRFGRTMEWDTAAGQCIAEEAGCRVLDATSRKRLAYGKEGFENSYFICCSPEAFARIDEQQNRP